MAEIAAILRELATLERDQRKHDLIALRRKLSLQIAEVGKAADPVFTAAADTELLREYRFKFSRMRSAAAMHQANWPAVRLGESVDEYRKSALAVREANRDFVAWTREALAALP